MNLGAGSDGEDAYRLLHDALQKAGRTGVGRWVFHNREYLVAVRPLDRVLAVHTMHFADELVDGKDLDVPEPSRAMSRREVEMAGQLVDSLHGRFDPDAFNDTYRERVLELLAQEARGEQPSLPEVEQRDQPTDLMAALEASLAGSSSKSGSGSGSGSLTV